MGRMSRLAPWLSVRAHRPMLLNDEAPDDMPRGLCAIAAQIALALPLAVFVSNGHDE